MNVDRDFLAFLISLAIIVGGIIAYVVMFGHILIGVQS